MNEKTSVFFTECFTESNQYFSFACGVWFQTEADSWHRWFQPKLLEFWQTCNLTETQFSLKSNEVLSALPVISKLRLWQVLKLWQWRHKDICNFKGYSLSNICSIQKSLLDAENLLLKEILVLLLVSVGKSRKWQQNSVSLIWDWFLVSSL